MCRGGCPAEVQCKAAGADKQGVLREGHQARGRSLGLDCCKGRRLAPGVGFEPDAAGRVVSSRRKTSRAVITRTIIDGTTDMRESPDQIVFTMARWRRGPERQLLGLMPTPSSCSFALPPQQSGPQRARDVGLGIPSKLRQSLAWRINR